ncbi:flavodoxin family protein [Thermodesulfovibrio yellowstonii]|uniref:NADPH-dependent fmn reductase domain protein n=1 Tax=Thermodesulfovibrio yellowstonii (strain ATCC 51303 / DSM 11347 / YP87) TaxID=289376 RepID=B5YKW4_THEYD|nr:flavodoxin family protein [Thermodesulfovibrio yellowstonii]ACI20488.1 NADPH-dependent fmn reductase domain protein [Thermodesulfovibrio yellowstonii DSM 11347]
MKVVAFNGSPRKNGNTYHAIKVVAEELKKENIKVEIIQVGNKRIRGCIACYKCAKNKNEKCSINDEVNEWIQKIKESDGIILGSPVYFSGIAGTFKCFLDRAFLVASVNDGLFRHKVGAAVVADRRSGGVTTFDQLLHYLHYAEMIVPSSNYWNVIYGMNPGEVLKDEEGMQIMRIFGKNMAWTLKLVENGKDKIINPEREAKIFTNFIR